jgi:hypothetical protein
MIPPRFIDGEGRVHEPIESLWNRVKRWARRKGHRCLGSHIEGVAPL